MQAHIGHYLLEFVFSLASLDVLVVKRINQLYLYDHHKRAKLAKHAREALTDMPSIKICFEVF